MYIHRWKNKSLEVKEEIKADTFATHPSCNFTEEVKRREFLPRRLLVSQRSSTHKLRQQQGQRHLTRPPYLSPPLAVTSQHLAAALYSCSDLIFLSLQEFSEVMSQKRACSRLVRRMCPSNRIKISDTPCKSISTHFNILLIRKSREKRLQSTESMNNKCIFFPRSKQILFAFSAWMCSVLVWACWSVTPL